MFEYRFLSLTIMKVSGFTFIKNAIKFDYPIVEAITSILPICDEFIVAVGDSEDETEELIQSINSDKIKIIRTTWNEKLREGGKVLADETNKAFNQISSDTDWCFYIQGDECVHEKYLENIKNAMLKHLDNQSVEGLLFNYEHFYGSYDYVGASKRWYRKEIRVIRNNKKISSYKDAQGFRIENRKLNVKAIDAYIYHYGWVKHPGKQQEKALNFNKLWHDDHWVKENIPDVTEFDYSNIDALKLFQGTHPAVMNSRIEKMNWKFSFNPAKRNIKFKYKVVGIIEKYTGYRIGEYKNYKLI